MTNHWVLSLLLLYIGLLEQKHIIYNNIQKKTETIKEQKTT